MYFQPEQKVVFATSIRRGLRYRLVSVFYWDVGSRVVKKGSRWHIFGVFILFPASPVLHLLLPRTITALQLAFYLPQRNPVCFSLLEQEHIRRRPSLEMCLFSYPGAASCSYKPTGSFWKWLDVWLSPCPNLCNLWQVLKCQISTPLFCSLPYVSAKEHRKLHLIHKMTHGHFLFTWSGRWTSYLLSDSFE